jgi:hypothetical protein
MIRRSRLYRYPRKLSISGTYRSIKEITLAKELILLDI